MTGATTHDTSPTPETEDVKLRCAGIAVARYDRGSGVPAHLSPRPHLHPVRTLGGTVVTEVYPADHRHHLGVGIAVADVAGTSFWGGTTFVSGRGPVLLDNHGRQLHRAWEHTGESRRGERLSWVDPDGTELLEEHRDIAAHPLGADAWALDLRTRLRNTSGRVLRVHSPATKGRPGAGYGGFFWRAPIAGTAPRCVGPDQEGEAALHGSRAAWLALSGVAPGGGRWTLVFQALGAVVDPWFLRAAEYPGVGTALAGDRPLDVPAGSVVERRVVTAVVDGHPDRAGLADLAAAARARAAEGAPAGARTAPAADPGPAEGDR